MPRFSPAVIGVIVVIAAALGGWAWLQRGAPRQSGAGSSAAEASEAQVREFCAACHAFPPPDSFPRDQWQRHVEQGYVFAEQLGRRLPSASAKSITAYYVNRAPVALDRPVPTAATIPSPAWRREGYAAAGRKPLPIVTNVSVVTMRPAGRPQVLVCEADPFAEQGDMLLLDPHASPPRWRTLARLPGMAHAEVVDLDADGVDDIIVACLGSFFPTDEKVGGVIWMRGRPDGGFEAFTIINGLGRVADVRAADFTGDGRLDLVVAEFGWHVTGCIRLLENTTTDWKSPQFVSRLVDDRPGAINVPVADLDGDGRPDFVALISQGTQAVVAYLNTDGRGFRRETIWAAPHPGFGGSGIELADLDADADMDVVFTNGDVLDEPFLLKPDNGVHWLENEGGYPFTHHRLATMPGVQRAVAGDVDGDGDLDIAAVSYVPAVEFPRDEFDLHAVLLLEQTAPGTFAPRLLESKTCDHFTCALGDLFGTGRAALVVGNFWSTTDIPIRDTLSIWTAP